MTTSGVRPAKPKPAGGQNAKALEKITRLQQEIATAPPEMAPMLHAILAHWHRQYFHEARLAFMRTHAAQSLDSDPATWDSRRIYAEIGRHFEEALKTERLLKSTPISAWTEFLEKGTMPEAYRPTLYDFIAYDALEFFKSRERLASSSDDDLEFLSNAPIFGSIDEFLRWQPESADPDSSTLKVIRLYQALVRFHQNDPAPALALAAVDLERLNWAAGVVESDEKTARHLTALKVFVARNVDLEIASLAQSQAAQLLFDSDNRVGARDLAIEGTRKFPDSVGARMCRNLIAQIEQKSISITTESVWADHQPTIAIRYANVTQAYFRIV